MYVIDARPKKQVITHKRRPKTKIVQGRVVKKTSKRGNIIIERETKKHPNEKLALSKKETIHLRQKLIDDG